MSFQKMVQYPLYTQQVLNRYLVMMMTMTGPSPEVHLALKGRTRYEVLYTGLGGAGGKGQKEAHMVDNSSCRLPPTLGAPDTFLILGLSGKSSLATPELLIPGCLSR